MSATVSASCFSNDGMQKNRAMTGSSERFEARGDVKTAIWSRSYANIGVGDAGMTGRRGNDVDEAKDCKVKEEERVEAMGHEREEGKRK